MKEGKDWAIGNEQRDGDRLGNEHEADGTTAEEHQKRLTSNPANFSMNMAQVLAAGIDSIDRIGEAIQGKVIDKVCPLVYGHGQAYREEALSEEPEAKLARLSIESMHRSYGFCISRSWCCFTY